MLGLPDKVKINGHTNSNVTRGPVFLFARPGNCNYRLVLCSKYMVF